MEHGFVHTIDPVMFRVWGIECYYYGLAYAIGFLGVFGWFRWRRQALGWQTRDVYDFAIVFAVCVLAGGRLFSVLVYHWDYYRDHLSEVLSYWRGGMASHGVLLGGIVGVWVFSLRRRLSFLRLADEIAVPAAFLLAVGRLGNFINGQIAGTSTNAWWGVKFPGIDGLRHPVTLYEAAKNLLLIPILLLVRRRWRPGTGGMTAHFVLWYGLLRIFSDCFREHGAELFGIGRNQYFNAAMAVFGAALLIFLGKRRPPAEQQAPATASSRFHGDARWSLTLRRIILVGIVLFSLVIRSAWTPEVLAQRRAAKAATEAAEGAGSSPELRETPKSGHGR